MRSFRELRPLAFLYAGRAGSAAVGILILPLLNEALGPAVFGLAGIVLSLQALVVVLDFGLSTSVGRAAAQLGRGEAWRALVNVRHAERLLFRLYALLALIGVSISLIVSLPVSAGAVAALMIGLAALTYQNVLFAALLGQQDYTVSSSVQLILTLARHLLALVAAITVAPDLNTFIYAHAAGALVHAAIFRFRFSRLTGAPPPTVERPVKVTVAWPLVVQGIAGACALQLDKPIVGGFAGAAATGPYFLASVLATVPLALLATPVGQYFQPKITIALAQSDGAAVSRNLRLLLLGMLAVVVIPAAGMLLTMDLITSLWLGGAEAQPLVSTYAKILLLGGAVGAVGLVPNILLIARGEFVYLAAVSSVLALAVLLGSILCASVGNIKAVCFVYVAYHLAATTALWLRASQIERRLNRSLASLPALAVSLLRHAGSRITMSRTDV